MVCLVLGPPFHKWNPQRTHPSEEIPVHRRHLLVIFRHFTDVIIHIGYVSLCLRVAFLPHEKHRIKWLPQSPKLVTQKHWIPIWAFMGALGIIKSEGCENRERGEPAVETVSHPLMLRSFEGRGLLNEEGDNERGSSMVISRPQFPHWCSRLDQPHRLP